MYMYQSAGATEQLWSRVSCGPGMCRPDTDAMMFRGASSLFRCVTRSPPFQRLIHLIPGLQHSNLATMGELLKPYLKFQPYITSWKLGLALFWPFQDCALQPKAQMLSIEPPYTYMYPCLYNYIVERCCSPA